MSQRRNAGTSTCFEVFRGLVEFFHGAVRVVGVRWWKMGQHLTAINTLPDESAVWKSGLVVLMGVVE